MKSPHEYDTDRDMDSEIDELTEDDAPLTESDIQRMMQEISDNASVVAIGTSQIQVSQDEDQGETTYQPGGFSTGKKPEKDAMPIEKTPQLPEQSQAIPHRRSGKAVRSCFYNYGPSFIPPSVADLAVKHYNTTDKPVASITKWINEKLISSGKPEIEVIDFYFLLVEWQSHGKIVDREPRISGTGELTVDEFNKFYTTWKYGGSSIECAGVIGRDSTTYTYHKIFAPLNKRDKKIRGAVDSNSHLKHTFASPDGDHVIGSTSLRRIFGVAERRVISGRLAFVLFADKLSDEVQQVLYDAVPMLRHIIENVNTSKDELSESDAPIAINVVVNEKQDEKQDKKQDKKQNEIADTKIADTKVIKEQSTPVIKKEVQPKETRVTRPQPSEPVRSFPSPTPTPLPRKTLAEPEIEKNETEQSEQSTSGHFRVGAMERRPNFGNQGTKK